MRRNENSVIRAPLYGVIYWVISLAVLILITSFICLKTGDPLSYTQICAGICMYLSSLISGIIVKVYKGTFINELTCTLFITAVSFIVSLTGNVSGIGIVMICAVIPVSVLGYLIPSIFSSKRKGKLKKRR